MKSYIADTVVKHVLNSIRELGAECAIAGGAVRDVYFGKEHKDIDIVVYNYMGMSELNTLL